MQTELTTYLRAGYPGLAITTAEEARASAEVNAACASTKRKLSIWSSTDGLIDLATNHSTPCPDPFEALQELERMFATVTPQHVVLMRDLQLHLDQADPMLVRRMKDLLFLAKGKGHCVILLGCRHKLPPELDHEITRIDYALPGPAQLGGVLDNIVRSAKISPLEPANREASVRAALGMTSTEAENAFALSVVGTKGIDPVVIAREKAHTLKKNGLVEVVEARQGLGDIGGLESLKNWLRSRASAFGDAARAYGLPLPKGLLIVGIPGTGKSLTAKATASAFGLPLLRLDMGKVFGGLVGQSEANLRSVIQTAEAIAPCVLWIDEIEKGFSGSQGSGNTDGGTSSRVFGSFLSWMQEKEKPVFVVATANDVSQLPPEFLRKGRFDEMFFVDLPDARERAAIWEIVIARLGRKPADFNPANLASACEQFTGAEIEAVFVEALYRAFGENREPANADIAAAIAKTVPLARTMDERIRALRHWANGRAQSAASPERQPAGNPRTTRRLEASASN
jgi:AAA+ superfamily predicted ATPase